MLSTHDVPKEELVARRIAYYLVAGALLLAVVTGLASATASAIIRMSAPPAFGTPLGAGGRAALACSLPGPCALGFTAG